ncbi:MAG: hypothetical protein WCX73_02970 [Candidatus Pacearchaeota archaeon]
MITDEDLRGDPEEIIKPLDVCKFCLFDYLLPPEQKKRKNLKLDVPDKHIDRGTIEQMCGPEHDKYECKLKYFAMRIPTDDRTAIQLGAMTIFKYDLGKKYPNIMWDQESSANEWRKSQDLGRKNLEGKSILESYAERFDTIWKFGLREFAVDEKERQILGLIGIYEMVVAGPELYETVLKGLEGLKQEHFKRDKEGIKR